MNDTSYQRLSTCPPWCSAHEFTEAYDGQPARIDHFGPAWEEVRRGETLPVSFWTVAGEIDGQPVTPARVVIVDGDDLSAQAARQLGAALIEAAQTLEAAR